jgi:riboflavin synthase
MFTGIIEEVGRVRRVTRAAAGARVEIDASRVLEGTREGDSISTDGVCLTALAITGSSFEADCSAETLRRTTIGRWKAGTPVNLERALALGDRLGGHLVQGHVDGVGELLSRRREGESEMLRFSCPRELERHVAMKGSVAVSGVSLTIAGLGEGWFEIAVIPTTLAWTTLGTIAAGDPVNLETDMLAKYVERILSADPRDATGRRGRTVEGLRELGY